MSEILRFRHNIMEVASVATFENIKGGINRNCKDVYFIRLLGANEQLLTDIRNMDELLGGRMLEGNGVYIRLQELGKLTDAADISYYTGCYDAWDAADGGKVTTKATAGDERLQEILGNAVREVCWFFSQGAGQTSESMKRNFAVKLLYWFDYIMERLNRQWDEKLSIKVVAANITKKQEYLFYYLLTLVGMDVLLIQNECDIDSELDSMGLSKKHELGNFCKCEIPAFDFKVCRKIQTEVSAGQNRSSEDYESGNETQDNREHTVRNDMESMAQNGAQNTVQSSAERTPVRITLPRHPRYGEQSQVESNNVPSGSIPPRNVSSGNIPIAGASGSEPVNERQEMSFESLAQLASSVVMIVIHNDKGEPIGSGSGIMIGRNGYILTNNHVACGGRLYSVRIEDDEQVYRTDEMIKYNPVLDLAIIRIDRQLEPLPIYNGQKKLVRGQKVVAIGSPLGLFNSVSDGIISGFRKIDDVDMIQFTAPISNGSSGGAVLNMYGEVIGISTSGFDAGQNINLAMGYECVNSFIRGFTG